MRSRIPSSNSYKKQIPISVLTKIWTQTNTHTSIQIWDQFMTCKRGFTSSTTISTIHRKFDLIFRWAVKESHKFIVINKHHEIWSPIGKESKIWAREREENTPKRKRATRGRDKERITSSSFPTKSYWFPALGDYWRREGRTFCLVEGEEAEGLGFDSFEGTVLLSRKEKIPDNAVLGNFLQISN
jgi:hypothetical protein